MISSAAEFDSLVTSSDPEERYRAKTDSAQVDVWRDSIARFPQHRYLVARNKTVPVEVLDQLSGDEDARVRRMVAMRLIATPQILERLAGDPDALVRRRVAENRQTSNSTLLSLAGDESDAVRTAAQRRLEGDDLSHWVAQVRDLCAELKGRIDEDLLDDVRLYAKEGDWELAMEVLADQLGEFDVPISIDERNTIADLLILAGGSGERVEFLDRLVQGA